MNAFPTIELNTLAMIGVFAGALMIFEGVRQLLTRSETVTEARSRRMRMIAKGATTEELLRVLRPSQEQWVLARLPFLGDLPAVLRQAGLTISPQVFLAAATALVTIIAVAASTVVPTALAVSMAALVGLVLPVVFVRLKRKRRIDTLVRQLPDALDLMARGLRVGHPLNTTVASVARDMPDPIATEFGILADQVSYGDDLVDAFCDFSDRIDIEDIRYLAVSVAIQHGTGGDLSRILDTLSRVIRDRISMRKKILSISSEGRLTAKFLSSLPLVILGGTLITSPEYYLGVMNDPLFRPIGVAIAALTVANYLVLRRLVHFRF